MKKKKILIVTTSAMTLATILKGQPSYLNQSFSVSVAASGDKYFNELQLNEKVETYCVPMKRGINPLFDLVSLFFMIRVILKKKPQLIHSYTPKAGLISMLGGLLCRVPVRIHTFTGLIFPTQVGIKKKILRLVDAFICFCATVVVPEGQAVKRDLLVHKVTRKNLKIIGNGNISGVDINYFDPDSKSYEKEKKELKIRFELTGSFVFVFVGRLNSDKGLDELVAAFQSINGKAAKLLIVGDVDSNAPTKKETLNVIQQNANIHWLGFTTDIRPALSVSDALILPSYREGFPNVLIQAGAMKLPTISTDVSGADEIIEDGHTGFIVPVKSVCHLRDKMNHLLNMDINQRYVIGEKARAHVSKLFEQNEYRECLKDFYVSQFSRCDNGRPSK